MYYNGIFIKRFKPTIKSALYQIQAGFVYTIVDKWSRSIDNLLNVIKKNKLNRKYNYPE